MGGDWLILSFLVTKRSRRGHQMVIMLRHVGGAMKKTIAKYLVAGGIVLSSTVGVGADTAVMRLEQGVALMADESRLRDAVREFEGVLLAEGKSQKLGAEARYRMAECYRKLGDDKAAEKQLTILLKNYPKENKWVVRARELASDAIVFGEIPWRDGEFLAYEIQSLGGETVGRIYSGIHASERDGEKTWVSHMTRSGGNLMQTQVEFLADNFRPLSGQSYTAPFGKLAVDFGEDGSLVLTRGAKKEVVSEVSSTEGGWDAEPFFGNDQAIQLLRLLEPELGAEVTLNLRAHLMGGGNLPFELKAVKYEEVTVPAGTFPCVKYKTNIGQTIWMHLAGAREMVQVDFGGSAKAVLVPSDAVRSLEEFYDIQAENMEVSLTLPGGTVWVPGVDSKKIVRGQIADPEFRIHEGMLEVQPTSNFEKKAQQSAKATLKLLSKGLANGFEEFETVAGGEVEVDQGRASYQLFRVKKGELEYELSLMVMQGEQLTWVARFHHSQGEGETVKAMLAEMAAGWKEE